MITLGKSRTPCDQNNANVDFAVMPTKRAGLVGCAANKMGWGSSNCAEGVLLMQYGLFPLFEAPNATPVGFLKHELGHILGFRHEHPWAPSQGGCGEFPTESSLDTTGRRLTAYDQTSVMHYPWCNGITATDLTISVLDGMGARTVYSMPAAWYLVVL
jgi:hypothetical protein